MVKSDDITICFIGIYVPYFFLPDYAVSNGLSKAKGALLLSIVGLSSGVGRVGSGYISSKPWADHIKIHNTLIIIGGLVTIGIPFTSSFHILIGCSIIFGIATGKFQFVACKANINTSNA